GQGRVLEVEPDPVEAGQGEEFRYLGRAEGDERADQRVPPPQADPEVTHVTLRAPRAIACGFFYQVCPRPISRPGRGRRRRSCREPDAPCASCGSRKQPNKGFSASRCRSSAKSRNVA